LPKITNELKKEVAKSEISYSKAVDSLKVQSVKLLSDLSDTKKELSRAKQKNYSLQLTVYDLIDKQSETKTVGGVENNNGCDSLIVTVEKLMQSSTEKDSLYEKTTVNLEDQLKNKDSTITLKEKQYGDIKSAFTKSIETSNEVSAQNKLLTKQVKRQKFKSKVLSAATLILTGAATNYLIHH
jgi:regulator of replication initiation timing